MKNTDMNIASLTPAKWREFLKKCLEANLPVFTSGRRGIGKSYMYADIATEAGLDSAVDIRLSIFDPSDLKGLPVPDVAAGFVRWLRDQLLPTDPDAKVLIILDELNSADKMVMGMAYQLVLDRKLGDYELPKGCRIVAAGNRVADRGVVNQIPAPLRNRFVQVELVPSVDDWASWATKNDVAPEVIAFQRWKQDQLHEFEPEMTAFPTPRAIVMASDALKTNPPVDLEMPLLEGCCGRGWALEFTGFLRTWRQLPDLDNVIANPETADVPTEPSTLYAVAGALAHKANHSNFSAICKYARRMGYEFATLLGLDALARDASLATDPEWIALAVEMKNAVRAAAN